MRLLYNASAMPKKILFATFSVWLKGGRTPINGMIEPLTDFLMRQKADVDLIDGMHPGSSDVITRFEVEETAMTAWVSMALSPFLRLQNTNATHLLFKIRDFLSVLELAVRRGKNYDLFIGLESVYTLAGIMLKRLGRVKTVVYYVSDYSPNRYSQGAVNAVYLWLDRYCCYHADFIWDVSKAFQPARIKAGLESSRCAPLIHVPNALFPQQICPLPPGKRIPFSLVFAGTLSLWNGPDAAVEAVALIRKKYPEVTLHIYGTNGKDQARVQALIQKLDLGSSVTFHGFIGDVIKLSTSINRYVIGLAPYRKLKGSHRAYGDATKLRLYMGAGLPIITTAVPPLGREIKDFGAGLVVGDDPHALAWGIEELFSNKKRYEDFFRKSILFAKNNTWHNVYSRAFRQMGQLPLKGLSQPKADLQDPEEKIQKVPKE